MPRLCTLQGASTPTRYVPPRLPDAFRAGAIPTSIGITRWAAETVPRLAIRCAASDAALGAQLDQDLLADRTAACYRARDVAARLAEPFRDTPSSTSDLPAPLSESLLVPTASLLVVSSSIVKTRR